MGFKGKGNLGVDLESMSLGAVLEDLHKIIDHAG